MSDELPPGGIVLSHEEINAKWLHCWSPADVVSRLDGVSAPWAVAAGWALDLFRGEQTREHEDLEIAIPAGHFGEIRQRLAEYSADVPADGQIWEDAAEDVLGITHQTWFRDPANGNYLVDVFREPHDGDTWICRRDETIRLPYAELIRHNADGIPYVIPEVVLLFKAKSVRPKDEADFAGALPLLDKAQRQQFKAWLTQVHPGHSWIPAI
ncbi:nucleotidyltransferase domain-containing protein [Catelliglobosispora koreensis]|uniref:nucleotidyltransferase domain-containing protein n=1 Tax=Catelliglobosispora koreensis TaxID=129052 RepID=UPI0003718767|nr:hypothetical protein [Catelliglobosispora koreensis]